MICRLLPQIIARLLVLECIWRSTHWVLFSPRRRRLWLLLRRWCSCCCSNLLNSLHCASFRWFTIWFGVFLILFFFLFFWLTARLCWRLWIFFGWRGSAAVLIVVRATIITAIVSPAMSSIYINVEVFGSRVNNWGQCCSSSHDRCISNVQL